MNDKLDKLFAAARTAKPDTARTELGFETRLLARLRAERTGDASWFAWAWKLAPVLAAVVVALGAWEFASADGSDLHTVITGQSDEELLVSYLTGD